MFFIVLRQKHLREVILKLIHDPSVGLFYSNKSQLSTVPGKQPPPHRL